MTENGSQNVKLFDGEDEGEYQSWKKWAKARLRVLRLKGLADAALGSELLTYEVPDSTAWEIIKDIPETEIDVEDGENAIYDALDSRYPEKDTTDRLGEAMTDLFKTKPAHQEQTKVFVGKVKEKFNKCKSTKKIYCR